MPGRVFATVGDNCIDRYGPPLSRAFVGGNAVNVAVHLARLGNRVAYFGSVADDADGARVRAVLGERHLDLSALRTAPGNTAFTDIAFAADGDRIFVHEDFGTCRGYRPDEAEVARLMTMDHVHIGWLDDGGALKRRLAAAGVSVSQDISVNAAEEDRSPAGLAMAFASLAEEEEPAPRLRAILEAGAALAVLMRGKAGSIASDGRTTVETGIHPVARIVDSTGAGDTFIAGFLDARIAGASLTESLEAGRDQAALTLLHLGGFPQDG